MRLIKWAGDRAQCWVVASLPRIHRGPHYSLEPSSGDCPLQFTYWWEGFRVCSWLDFKKAPVIPGNAGQLAIVLLAQFGNTELVDHCASRIRTSPPLWLLYYFPARLLPSPPVIFHSPTSEKELSFLPTTCGIWWWVGANPSFYDLRIHDILGVFSQDFTVFICVFPPLLPLW